MAITIAVTRPIPPRAWSQDTHCRLTEGYYSTEPPNVREVYLPTQIASIVGWSFSEWEGGEPVTVRLYVRVDLCQPGVRLSV